MIFDLLFSIGGIPVMLSLWIEGVHDNLFSSFDFGAAEGTTLKCVLVNVGDLMGESGSRITCPSESTCHAVRQGVHNKCPHGSIRISLSFSAHILHN